MLRLFAHLYSGNLKIASFQLDFFLFPPVCNALPPVLIPLYNLLLLWWCASYDVLYRIDGSKTRITCLFSGAPCSFFRYVQATGWDDTCFFPMREQRDKTVGHSPFPRCASYRMRRITWLFSGAPSSSSYGMRCASYRMRRKLPFLLCAMLLFRRCVSYQMRRNLPFVRFAKFIFMWYASYRMRRHLPFLRCARLDSGRPAWRSRTGLSLSAELKYKNNIFKKLKRKGNWMKLILHRYIFNSCRPSGHGKML